MKRNRLQVMTLVNNGGAIEIMPCNINLSIVPGQSTIEFLQQTLAHAENADEMVYTAVDALTIINDSIVFNIMSYHCGHVISGLCPSSIDFLKKAIQELKERQKKNGSPRQGWEQD